MQRITVSSKLVSVFGVLLLQLVATQAQDPTTPTDFPSLDSLQVRASRINRVPSEPPSLTEFRSINLVPQQAILPSVTFTGSGEIKFILFIGQADCSNPESSRSPTFKIWTPQTTTNSDGTNVQYTSRSIASGDIQANCSNGVRLFSAGSGLSFEANDVLGIGLNLGSSISSSLIFPQYLADTNTRVLLGHVALQGNFGANVPTSGVEQTFTQTAEEFAHPLLSIETDSGGVEGSLNLSVLQSVLAQLSTRTSHRVLPTLDIQCSGELQALFIGATRSMMRQGTLRLSIWSCMTTQSEPLGGTTTSCDRSYNHTVRPSKLELVATNVYRVEMQQSLIVESGRYFALGIEQFDNASVMVYDRMDLATQRSIPIDETIRTVTHTILQPSQIPLTSQPLIAIQYAVTGQTEGAVSCTGGFMDTPSLEQLALLIQPTSTEPQAIDGSVANIEVGYQYLFPSLTFNAGLTLRSFQFSGLSNDGVASSYPHLQIWRTKVSAAGGEASEIELRFSTHANGIEKAPTEVSLNTYSYDGLDVQLETGDFVGLYQPAGGSGVVRIAFQQVDDPSTVYYGLDVDTDELPSSYETERAFSTEFTGAPLITAQVESEAVSTEPPLPTAVDITVTNSDMTSSPTDPATEQEAFTTAAIETTVPAGGSSQVTIIAGASVVGVVIFLLLLLVVFLVVVIFTMRSRRKYRMSAVDNKYADVTPGSPEGARGEPSNGMAASYEVPSTVIYQTIGEAAQPYEVPAALTAQPYEVPARTGVSGQTPAPLYHTLEPTKLQEVGNGGSGKGEELELSVIVPTTDQREHLHDDKDIYASLIEIQSIQAAALKSGSGVFFEESTAYWAPASSPAHIYQQLATKKYREIPRKDIQITEVVGTGHFAEVHKGVWQTARQAREVAVKTLKKDANSTDKVKFLQEVAINGQFRHPNVVSLLGVVTIGEPVMIVMELMEDGDLRSYLKDNFSRSPTAVSAGWPSTLLGFCQHIAAGMDYLAKKGFIHRDLAARNILVTAGRTCKVTDFGMSRDLESENYYVSKGGVLPVKWTAPEAISYRKFSTASDVWSFGCVMYEIWSLGHKPFEGFSNIQCMQLLGSGFRLAPPPGCSRPLYELMIRCWHSDYSLRPMFTAIFNMLSHSPSHLLSWSDKDLQLHPQVASLGAPTDVTEDLYPDLQDYYVVHSKAAKKKNKKGFKTADW